MIANDNGPPDGDYVRYIEGLMARASSTLATKTKSQVDLAPDRIADHAMHGAASATSALPAMPRRPIDPGAAQAMANALMTDTSTVGAASNFADRYHWLLGAAGVIALLYAMLAPGINFIFVLIGIALLNWFVKLRKQARDRALTA